MAESSQIDLPDDTKKTTAGGLRRREVMSNQEVEMTTITHVDGAASVRPGEQSKSGKLPIICLVAWVFLGPVLGILYENYVNGQEWADLAALSALRQDDIKAAYFSHAELNVFGGAIVWAAGMVLLAFAGLRDRA